MRIRINIWICFIGLLAISCSDFLDENPDRRVTLDNLEKAEQLLVNAYSVASPNFSDWMTDDVQFTQGTNIRLNHEQTYEWSDVTTGPDELDTPDFYWFQSYSAIAHSNEVLAVLDDIEVKNAQEQTKKNAIESEALLTRAYAHFMLVNFFGQHYSPSAGKGVPYIKTPETTFLAQYERKSVRKVYDDVEDDLIRGLELLDDRFFNNSGKYHFNRNAALAFASRFYLFKGDYLRCLQYSDQLLGSNPGAFIRDLTAQNFQLAGSSVTEYPRLYSSPDQASNLLLIRKISLVQRTDFAYGPDQDFYRSLFSASLFPGLTDERENPAFVKGLNGVYPVRYQSLFERSSLNSNVGFPYYIHIAFTGEEVVLNRAEANAWQGNYANSIVDLQALSEKRFSGGVPTITLQELRNFYGSNDDLNNILSYIIFLERRKEFIMQGMRWFDIKRFQLSVVHADETGFTFSLNATDDRKALQIPQSAIDVGGLEPNPR
jgi:starch-binding outer membrane protein, SusD/RagB family